MMKFPAVILFLGALCACPESGKLPASQTTATAPSPGARLKPQVLSGDDGLVIQTGRIVDTDFGVICSPKFVGTRLVCFPDAPEYTAQLFGFVDAECTKKAAIGNARTKVLLSGASSSTPAGQVFKRGDAADQNFSKQLADGSCSPTSLAPGNVSYAVGDDVTDTLVGLTEEAP